MNGSRGNIARLNTGTSVVIPWYLSGGVPVANCIAAYQPKGAASLAVSYVNLVSPGTYDITEVAAPTWDNINGWQGVNWSALATGIILPIGGAYSCAYKFTNSIDGALFGSTDMVNDGFFVYNSTFTDIARNSESQNTAGVLASGVIVLADDIYKNGVANGTPFATNYPAQFDNVYILAAYRQDTGLAWAMAAVQIQAISFYNIRLNAAQAGAISVAMAAL